MPAVKDPATGKFVSADKVAGATGADAGAQPGADGKAKKEPQVEIPALAELSRRFLGEDKPPVDDPKKKEAADAAKTADVKKPEPKKKVVVPTATETLLARTTDVLEKVASGLSGKGTAPDKKEDELADPLADLDPSERRKVNVLRQMETDFPDRPEYKGLADKYLTGQKKLDEYVSKWQTDHPGEEFDDKAEDHKPFFEAHDVDWNDEDYIESLTNIKSKAAIEDHDKRVNSKLSEVERSQKLIESKPAIASEGITAARTFWKNLDPELAEVLSPHGAVDAAKLEELKKSDPVKYNVATQTADRVEGLTSGMYKLLNGLELFNDKSTIHQHLADFAVKQEQALLSRPPEDQKDAQGRAFKTRVEYRKLSEDDKKKYWTFSATDFGLLIAHEEANRASAFLTQKEEEFRQMAAARGIQIEEKPLKTAKTLTVAGAKNGNENTDDDDETPDDDDGKPRSPSSGGEPKVAAVAKKNGGAPKTAVDAFMARYTGKS